MQVILSQPAPLDVSGAISFSSSSSTVFSKDFGVES